MQIYPFPKFPLPFLLLDMMMSYYYYFSTKTNWKFMLIVIEIKIVQLL